MQAACKLECMCVAGVIADICNHRTFVTGMSYRPWIKGSPPSLDPVSAQLVICLTRPLFPSYCCYRDWLLLQVLASDTAAGFGWVDR